MHKAKTILMLSPDELTSALMACRLKTWGYNATIIEDCGDVVPELQQDAYDLVILMPSPDAKTWMNFHLAAVSAEYFQTNRGGTVRIYDPAEILESAQEIALGVSRIHAVGVGTESLKEAVRIAMQRKRGPRAPVPDMYIPRKAA